MTLSVSPSSSLTLAGSRTRGRLFIPIVFLLTVLLIDVTLYMSAEDHLSLILSNGIEIDTALLTAVFPLFSFNIALVILIVLPYLLLQANYYYPIEVRKDLDLNSGTFLHILEQAIRLAVRKAVVFAESLVGLQRRKALVHEDQAAEGDCSTSVRQLITDMNSLLLAQPSVPYAPQQMNVEEVLVKALHVVRPLIEEKRQTIVFQPPEERDIRIDADARLLEHVLHVLIGNTSHLSHSGSTIVLSVKALPATVTISIMDVTGRDSTNADDSGRGGSTSTNDDSRFVFSMTPVRDIVNAAHGQFWFADHDEQRVRCFVELPRSLSSPAAHEGSH